MKNRDIRSVENLLCDRHVFDIRWHVTSICNYDCAFCIQGSRQAHRAQAQGESAVLRGRICSAIRRIIEGLTAYRSVKVSLIGGEVTILRDFPQILESLALSRFPGAINFDITTNFSANIDSFKRLCDIIQIRAAAAQRSLTIGTSFYPAYVTYQAFTQKLLELYACSRELAAKENAAGTPGGVGSNRVRFTVGIPILTDADHDVLTAMRWDFEDTDVSIQPIYIRKYETHISPEHMQTLFIHEEKHVLVTGNDGRVFQFQNIQALGAALEDVESFCPDGYTCDAGIRNIWVDAFGNVKRCPALGSTMSMGSLLDGSFRLYDAPMPCSSDHCSCSQYGRIEKPKE